MHMIAIYMTISSADRRRSQEGGATPVGIVPGECHVVPVEVFLRTEKR